MVSTQTNLHNVALTPQEKLKYIYKFLPFGITRIDFDGNLLYWGENIQRLLGYTVDEVLVVKNFSELFIQPTLLQTMLADVKANGETNCKIYLRNKNGDQIYVLLGLFWEDHVDHDPTVAVLTIDISTEAHLEQQIASKDQSLKLTFEELLSSYKYIGSVNRQLAMLISTINETNQSQTLEESLDMVTDLFKNVVSADMSFIRMNEGDNLALRSYKGPQSNRPRKYLTMEESLFFRLDLGEKMLIISDITQDERYRSTCLPEIDVYKSLLLYPLTRQGRFLGELVAYGNQVNKFSDIDKPMVDVIAGLSAMVICLQSESCHNCFKYK